MKTQIKYCLQILVVLFFGSALYAQTVTGVVTGVDGPLAGVNVIEKGTTNGAATVFAGNYRIILLNPQAILVFSEFGSKTKEISVNRQTHIDVGFLVDVESLFSLLFLGFSS